MDRQQRIDLIVFAANLGALRSWIEYPRDITSHGRRHEDDPPAEHSAEAGIENLRYRQERLSELEDKAATWPNNSLSRRVREWFAMVHEEIRQSDKPAEMAMLDGEEREARHILRDAIKRVRRLCLPEMARLMAKLHVASQMGWPGEAQTDQEPPITQEEINERTIPLEFRSVPMTYADAALRFEITATGTDPGRRRENASKQVQTRIKQGHFKCIPGPGNLHQFDTRQFKR
jgi:hypothetical protein